MRLLTCTVLACAGSLKNAYQTEVCVRAEDPLVGSIAQQLLTDREAHDKTAAEWTRRYAQG